MAESEFDKLLRDAESVGDVDTLAVTGNLREIRAMLKTDSEFFIEFFLAEHLDMPVPEFHQSIWSLLTDEQKERVLLAIPRDHAKTTLAKLVVVWYWLFTSHRFCAYLSNTNPIAKGACKDIMEFMKCDNFRKVFGYIKIIKESENESLWIFDLTLPNGTIKRCILRALGQGQQMRGINIDNQRPDIAVIDDVEDNDNTDSEYQQKKLDKWMFGPFMKALARKKKILWLGNMLSKTSLLARLSRNPKWNPVVYGCLIKDPETGLLSPLWPGKWTVDTLQEDFKEYRDLGLIESWMCEMMNMPGHGENGFRPDQLFYMPLPNPDECECAFITIDPAFGLKKHNDESAVAVHVLVKGSTIPRTVAVGHGRWDETRLFNETLALASYWNAWVWGIESIAAQRLLIPLFGLLLAGRSMHDTVEMIPLMSGSGDPKISRIRAWVSLMDNEEWAIPEGDMDITTQTVSYNVQTDQNEDDIIDSCAYGPILLNNYMGLIKAKAAGLDVLGNEVPQYGMEVSGV